MAPSTDPDALTGVVERTIERACMPSTRIAGAAWRMGLPVASADPVEAVASLRRLPPTALEPLAVKVTRPQSLAATAQGFATSFGGLATLPVRLSADAALGLWFAVRATSAAMGAFGFPPETPQGQALLRAGLLHVTGGHPGAADDVLGTAARHVTVNPQGTRMLAASARTLVRRVCTATGRGQWCRMAPVVGGVVGGAVNGSAVHLIARRARRHYRTALERWQDAVDAGDVDALAGWTPAGLSAGDRDVGGWPLPGGDERERTLRRQRHDDLGPEHGMGT